MRTARVALLAVTTLLGGCGAVIGLPILGAAALAPAMLPLMGGGEGLEKGDAVGEFGYAHVGGDGEVEGGHAFSMRSVGFLGGRGAGLLMTGRLQVGSYGRDRVYAFDGFDVGVGLRVPRAFAGLGLGYEYGGFPQIGHTVPLRATTLLHLSGGVALQASGYLGRRFAIRDEYPAATDTLGPFNTWGGEVGLVLGGHRGVAVVGGFDRQDDLSIATIHVDLMMAPAPAR